MFGVILIQEIQDGGTPSVKVVGTLEWRVLKTPTFETPDSEFTWPRSRFTTSGPDPLGLTGRAWLQAGAQRVVIVGVPSLNSLGIDSRNEPGSLGPADSKVDGRRKRGFTWSRCLGEKWGLKLTLSLTEILKKRGVYTAEPTHHPHIMSTPTTSSLRDYYPVLYYLNIANHVN